MALATSLWFMPVFSRAFFNLLGKLSLYTIITCLFVSIIAHLIKHMLLFWQISHLPKLVHMCYNGNKGENPALTKGVITMKKDYSIDSKGYIKLPIPKRFRFLAKMLSGERFKMRYDKGYLIFISEKLTKGQ